MPKQKITITLDDDIIAKIGKKFGFLTMEQAIESVVKNALLGLPIATGVGTGVENDLTSKGFDNLAPDAQKLLDDMRKKSEKPEIKGRTKREYIHLAGSTM